MLRDQEGSINLATTYHMLRLPILADTQQLSLAKQITNRMLLDASADHQIANMDHTDRTVDSNRFFRHGKNKDIDFVLIYKIPLHRKDPEINDSPATGVPATGPATGVNGAGGQQGDKQDLAARTSGGSITEDAEIVDARRAEEKHIRNRRNFHRSLREAELGIELDEFRVSGDNLRVVKLNVPNHILMKYAQEFCFEKPLKCDRATMNRRKGKPPEHLRPENAKVSGKNGSKYKAMEIDDEENGVFFEGEEDEEEEEDEEKGGIIKWIEDKIFYFLHGREPFYMNMRKNFYPKFIKAPFVSKHKDKFLGSEKPDFFTTAERSAVVHRILQKATYHKDGDRVYFGIDELVANGSYKAAYPLHDGPDDIDRNQVPTNHRQLLRYYWATFRMWNRYQPLNLIRMYFGEKVGMYFAWTGFYTQTLFIPAMAGAMVFGYGLSGIGDDFISKDICKSGTKYKMCPLCEDSKCPFFYLATICGTAQMATSVNNGATLFFCVFMSMWVAYFLEMWKRKQSMLGHIWGTLNFETSDAQVRPTYTQNCDSWKFNPLTRRYEPYMSTKRRYPRYVTTFVSILAILACVIIFALAVIVYDLAVYLAMFENAELQKYARLASSVSAGIMSLTLIIIMSKYYTKFAIFVTEWENHKTQMEYENNLTIRRYIFEVFNFYSSLVYIGFFKGKFNGYPGHHPRVFGVKMEDCPPGGCISELAVQMAIILAGKQFIFTFSSFVIPIISSNKGNCLAKCKEKKKVVGGKKTRKPPWERDYLLAETRDVFGEYLEMVIQYGFVTIFVAAFPLAPLLALVNNILEMRLDSFKFVAQLRRPTGFKCKDIGIWSDILSTVGKIAVVCNAVIIAFSSDFIPMTLYALENKMKTAKRKNGNPFHGYVNFSLAYASPKMTKLNDTCRYWAYRDEDGRLNFFYWKVFTVKLLFVIFFEHLVFGIVKCIDIFIPDIPDSVQLKIDIDKMIAKERLGDEPSTDKKTAEMSTMTDTTYS